MSEQRASAEAQERPARKWRWRTFPVFFAFACGLLLASVINGEPSNAVAGVLQIVALLAVGYGVAHIVVTNVVAAGRLRRRGASTPDDEWVDEIVHPE